MPSPALAAPSNQTRSSELSPTGASGNELFSIQSRPERLRAKVSHLRSSGRVLSKYPMATSSNKNYVNKRRPTKCSGGLGVDRITISASDRLRSTKLIDVSIVS